MKKVAEAESINRLHICGMKDNHIKALQILKHLNKHRCREFQTNMNSHRTPKVRDKINSNK